jgi:hypothetical protein
MNSCRRPVVILAIPILLGAIGAASAGSPEPSLPPFGRDTVLVWKVQIQDDVREFVVRIAEFSPDRFVEWEDATTQGTIFMPSRALASAKIFVNASLFEGGVDTKGKDKTTLWLSQQIFKDLKAKRRLKLSLDGIDGWFTVEGSEQITVEVNREPMSLPVLDVADDRGSRRSFLDSESNPLLVRHTVRAFSQTLTSITTDRPNTLRWIKGRKLTNPH